MSSIRYPSVRRRGRTAAAEGEAHVRGLIEQILFTKPGERVNGRIRERSLAIGFAPHDPRPTPPALTLQAARQRARDLIDVTGWTCERGDAKP